MAATIAQLCDDLAAERADLFSILDSLDVTEWAAPTPARPWSVCDQVAHLAWFDDAAHQSITDPDAFLEARPAAIADVDGFVDAVRRRFAEADPVDLSRWLRRATDELVAAARAADPMIRVPWYGPDMTVASCVTARIMETWAHGQDIADAVHVPHVPTDRLRHVAFLAVRALPNSFRAHGLDAPAGPVRVELVAPSGGIWEFGPAAGEAVDVVRGSALDFCLLATQRSHRDDTDVVAHGPIANQWLDVAQAFAGPPGAKREPGARARPPDRGSTR